MAERLRSIHCLTQKRGACTRADFPRRGGVFISEGWTMR